MILPHTELHWLILKLFFSSVSYILQVGFQPTKPHIQNAIKYSQSFLYPNDVLLHLKPLYCFDYFSWRKKVLAKTILNGELGNFLSIKNLKNIKHIKNCFMACFSLASQGNQDMPSCCLSIC